MRWPARLGERGIEWRPPSSVAGMEIDTQQTEARMQQTFRWLLRRFVDPEWIDERVQKARDRTGEPPHRATASTGQK